MRCRSAPSRAASAFLASCRRTRGATYSTRSGRASPTPMASSNREWRRTQRCSPRRPRWWDVCCAVPCAGCDCCGGGSGHESPPLSCRRYAGVRRGPGDRRLRALGQAGECGGHPAGRPADYGGHDHGRRALGSAGATLRRARRHRVRAHQRRRRVDLRGHRLTRGGRTAAGAAREHRSGHRTGPGRGAARQHATRRRAPARPGEIPVDFERGLGSRGIRVPTGDARPPAGPAQLRSHARRGPVRRRRDGADRPPRPPARGGRHLVPRHGAATAPRFGPRPRSERRWAAGGLVGAGGGAGAGRGGGGGGTWPPPAVSQAKLRADLVVVEQRYRGEQTYIVKDPETHKYFRFGPVEMVVMQELDGERTSAEVAAELAAQGLPFTAATVDGFARKLSQMGLLERSLAQRSVLLMERLRAERHRRVARTHYTGSLLRMRWSVGDPDRMLDRWTPRLKFFFSKPFLLLSVALFAVYGVIFVTRWPQLSQAIKQLYTLSSWTVGTAVLFWLTAIVIIAIHELGHGVTCKHFGGQVHEIGAMLIYFQPAFFCNVNDAWTFPELRARLWVTAAGAWIQLVVAGLAAIVWWMAEPGTLVSRVALFSVVIGGATTVLANANPLIPLDGYYALSDYLEIPNLRARAFGYLGWLVKRHVLRLEVPAPPADERERHIFLIYGALAFVYSVNILLLLAGLALGWANRTLGAIGVTLFALALAMLLRNGLRGAARAVATALREHRAGAWLRGRWRRAAGGAVAILVLGFLVPWPITVDGSFTAVAPLRLALKAPDDGVVTQMQVTEGQRVAAGTPLVTLRNIVLEQQVVVWRRLADSLAALEVRARARDHAAIASRRAAERAEAQAELAGVTARLQALALRAPITGVVVTPRPEETLGRRMAASETVLRLEATDSLELRVALDRARATLGRRGQPAALIAYADVAHPLRAQVASVAVAAGGRDALEARVRVSTAGLALRPGVPGQAKIVVRRSSVWGALWWSVRRRVRRGPLLWEASDGRASRQAGG